MPKRTKSASILHSNTAVREGMKMAHAKYSPSSANRWLHCPDSATVAHLYPNTDSAASREGTKQHARAERLLLSGEEKRNA